MILAITLFWLTHVGRKRFGRFHINKLAIYQFIG